MYCTYCGTYNEGHEAICVNCGVKLLPHVDLKALTFKPVESSWGQRFAQAKVSFLFKGDLKKLVQSIEGGTCGITKVIVEKTFCVKEYSNDPDYPERLESLTDYVNIQTLQGNPINQAIRVLGYFINGEMQEAYIFHYKMKKKDRYVLIKSDNVEDILGHVEEILELVKPEVVDRQEAPHESSLVDKAKMFYKGLFNRK